MIISISSIIDGYGYLGKKMNFSGELFRYFSKEHFKELNRTGNICLEASWVFNDSMTLEDYMKIDPRNKIVTLQYTFDSYKENDVTFFRFYLNEQSIDQEKFKDNLHLDMNSIRFAYPIIVGSEIKMFHIVADRIYLDLKSRIK